MKKNSTLNFLFPAIACLLLTTGIKAQTETFNKRVVASGFNNAWEVVYGPNDSLWVTDCITYRIYRVSVSTGAKTTLVDLRLGPGKDATINFTGGQLPQGGLMGLAIHPNLYSTDPVVRAAKPWVYAAYTYNRGSCPGTNTSCIFTTKIIRFDYVNNLLINPTIVLDGIPGSSDHNSGRLVIGPTIENGSDAAHTQYRLYYTVGDMGCGQFLNTTRTENAQNVNVIEGKSLRLNTESDGDAGLDAWIPNDNPFYVTGAVTPKDYVFTMGHRNPQGLAWGSPVSNPSAHILYSSEQGDRTDDELNILQAGKNYGWDQVTGYCDNNINGFKIGQNTNPNESAFCSVPANNNVEPIFTLFTQSAAGMAALYAQGNNLLWPTVACSSVEFYGHNVIPNWPNSLLVTPLKLDKVFRLKLTNAGTAITGDTISYFKGDGNRIRRIMAAPDGLRFYVARDVGATSNAGTIIEYTYTGALLAIDPRNDTNNINTRTKFSLFPNPATSMINIDGIRGVAKPISIQICDISGRMLKQGTYNLNNFQVDIASFAPGTYFVKLYNGHDVLIDTEKFIKVNNK